jgi:hypothetical protein
VFSKSSVYESRSTCQYSAFAVNDTQRPTAGSGCRLSSDTSFSCRSTVGRAKSRTEFIVSFTHDVELDHILPGILPTGKWVEVPHVVVVTFVDDKIASEHIYWDQASVLVQVGLLDRDGLPVVGAEQAGKLSKLIRS